MRHCNRASRPGLRQLYTARGAAGPGDMNGANGPIAGMVVGAATVVDWRALEGRAFDRSIASAECSRARRQERRWMGTTLSPRLA